MNEFLQGIRGLTILPKIYALTDYASIMLGIIWINRHNFSPFYKNKKDFTLCNQELYNLYLFCVSFLKIIP